jgi:hypothetical protein
MQIAKNLESICEVNFQERLFFYALYLITKTGCVKFGNSNTVRLFKNITPTMLLLTTNGQIVLAFQQSWNTALATTATMIHRFP